MVLGVLASLLWDLSSLPSGSLGISLRKSREHCSCDYLWCLVVYPMAHQMEHPHVSHVRFPLAAFCRQCLYLFYESVVSAKKSSGPEGVVVACVFWVVIFLFDE